LIHFYKRQVLSRMSCPYRVRYSSVSSEGSKGEGAVQRNDKEGVAYDVDGKFSFSQVMKARLMGQMKSTVDENGKFDYIRADMRPVPPGWYDLDQTKHAVPKGWYIMGSSAPN